MDSCIRALDALKQKLGDCVHTQDDELYGVSYDGLKVRGSPEREIHPWLQ